MSTYEILLFLHLVSVALLIAGFGVSTATGIGMSRTTDTKLVGTLARISSTAEYAVTIPGAIGAIVFGSWLVDEAGFDFGDTWLVLSYVLWAIALGIGALVLGPHGRRVARQAASLVADGVGESEELRKEAAKPAITMLGMLEVVFIVAFLWLMVAKPGA
jgi:uncharacterized membrane protein